MIEFLGLEGFEPILELFFIIFYSVVLVIIVYGLIFDKEYRDRIFYGKGTIAWKRSPEYEIVKQKEARQTLKNYYEREEVNG